MWRRWLTTLVVTTTAVVGTLTLTRSVTRRVDNAVIDSLLVLPLAPAAAPNTPVQLCAFPVFVNGAIGLPRQESAACSSFYRTMIPAPQQRVTKRQQAVLDTLGPTTWGLDTGS